MLLGDIEGYSQSYSFRKGGGGGHKVVGGMIY